VTTFLPLFIDLTIMSFASEIPPISSTIISIAGLFTNSKGSFVRTGILLI